MQALADALCHRWPLKLDFTRLIFILLYCSGFKREEEKSLLGKLGKGKKEDAINIGTLQIQQKAGDQSSRSPALCYCQLP